MDQRSMRIRNPNSVVYLIRSSFTSLIILFIFTGLLKAEDTPSSENRATEIDSLQLQPYPERMSNRSTWEKIVYLPGQIVQFPLQYTFKGIGITVGYIDDTKIVQQINDKLESDDERRQLKPTYANRTGAGFMYYQRGILTHAVDRNILSLTATASLDGRQKYQALFEDLEIGYGGLMSDFMVRYWKLAEESFFDLGPHSSYSNESCFSMEQTTLEAKTCTDLTGYLRYSNLEAVIGYQYTNIAKRQDDENPSTTDVYSDTRLPGIHDLVDMAYLNILLSFDTKNRPGNPTRGMDAVVSGALYRQVWDDRFGFAKYSLNVQKYIHLFYNRVMVMRLACKITNPFKNKDIPFYYLSELGREESIRGFVRGRFRDRDVLLGSLEYRYPVWHNWDEHGLDLFIFIDSGQVSAKIIREAALNDFRYGYGLGFRLWDQKGLIARLQAGWSEDGWRLYLGIN